MPTIQSADQTSLHLRRWEPPAHVRAEVLIVHGLGEHAGRYDHVAAALHRASYGAQLIELRGNGDSAGKRGHIDSWSQFTEDIQAAAATIGGPFFLLGHSMGGLASLEAIRTGLSPLGVALSDPLLGVAVEAPVVKEFMARLISRILPRLSLGNELDATHICRDKAVVEKYLADEKVYDTITPRWYTEMLAAQIRVLEAAESYQVPLLALLGEGDLITSIPISSSFFDRYGNEDKKRILYPGLYHEIFNEPEQDQVLGDLVAWLDSRTQA